MEPKNRKQTVRASDNAIDYTWCTYSFYGNAIPLKKYDKPTRADRKAYPLGKQPASIPLRAVLVRGADGTFLSDGGGTYAELKKRYGMTESAFREHLGLLYGAGRVCLLGEREIAVRLQKDVPAEKAEQILCTFVERVGTVCSVIEKK